MANPLDWENTPAFLKKQFPHWKKSAATSPLAELGDDDESSFRPRQNSFNKQPANTAMYSVLSTDTLNSIALKFNSTPSQLCQLNKMTTRTVLPGQILYVPDVLEQSSSQSLEVNDEQRPRSGSATSSIATEEITSSHIKIRAKYITKDQGCCKGTLLMTSSSILFKPNENDPLVLEHGMTPFGVILPMRDITTALIVSDFAKLVDMSPKLKRSTNPVAVSSTTEITADISTEQTRPIPSHQSLPSSEVDSGCVEGTMGHTSSAEENRNCVETEKPPRLRILAPSNEDKDLSPLPPTPGRVVRVFSELDDVQSKTTNGKLTGNSTDEMLAIMGAVEGEQDTTQDGESDSVNPCIHQLLTNPETMSFRLYRSMDTQSDSTTVHHKDIDVPQFLKIRVASHAYHTFVPTVGVTIPQQAGAKVRVHTKTEFWFAIPSERTDELIAFFMANYPHQINDTGFVQKWNDGMFILISEQTNSSGSSMGELGYTDNYYSNTSSSWEVYSLADIPRERIHKMEVEDDLPLPSLSEESELMDPFHIQQLSKKLLSAAIGHDWVLLYSTFKHGMSLRTLYRNMVDYGDNPVLLFVKDTHYQTFGAMLSCQLKISEHYYGTGESFLFKFKPNETEGTLELKVYNWSGENDFIVKGNVDSLVFGGGGDGHFGLWIDDQFYHGASYVCRTFNNECLSTKTDFIYHGVEVWGFV
ncbi:oxidation resistance protein 1-like isoform X2 [Dysidea avara]